MSQACMSTVDEAIAFLNDAGYAVVSEEEPAEAPLTFLWNAVAALFCVCLAAIAAGLTLGLLGLDPLMLLIKERAGLSEEERSMASKLLPIVKQHHRLLVTLLLMNSIANEALPIFLESLVPPSVAILLSVTLVLFFGEIIPSAVFTGPDQLKIASHLTPLVNFFMLVLYPIAGPIAKLLDCLLHDEEELAAYNRGELTALIRIQYEERLASKRKHKAERAKVKATLATDNVVGSIDFVEPSRRPSMVRTDSRKLRKGIKNHIEHFVPPTITFTTDNGRASFLSSADTDGQTDYSGGDSIHPDEVMIVEGALQMRTKTAFDIMQPKRLTFRLPRDLILDEHQVVSIYSSGFSRIPIYVPPNKEAICGVLIVKQLIVVNPEDKRPLCTLPLYVPIVVGPNIRLVDLLNLLQTGGGGMKGGHMAMVCADPKLAQESLNRGEPIPKNAGWMGVITLEDVLEELLQEHIYDEYDKMHMGHKRLATMVWKQWKKYKARKTRRTAPRLRDVEEGSIEDASCESTPLISKK